eukprot:COSAG04_NODE_2089_length_4822_cov_39.655939_4_plen_98_part_00
MTPSRPRAMSASPCGAHTTLLLSLVFLMLIALRRKLVLAANLVFLMLRLLPPGALHGAPPRPPPHQHPPVQPHLFTPHVLRPDALEFEPAVQCATTI